MKTDGSQLGLKQDIVKSRLLYGKFIDLCYVPFEGFKLTPNSEVSPYALCFAIFGKHLIGQLISKNNILLYDNLLRDNIDKYREKCINAGKEIRVDKGYLQLLTFTLSSLEILGTLKENPLNKHVSYLINSDDVIDRLESEGVFIGKPGSGNLAMFYAVLLLHSKIYLNLNLDEVLDQWVQKHFDSMNSNGFWGSEGRPLYLQFQNGYHQYEIFEFLNLTPKKSIESNKFVFDLSDSFGHFAPYPGGGGCYDYDAIFILTFLGKSLKKNEENLLKKTYSSILSEQNIDGGFCESQYIRPLNSNLKSIVRHIFHKKLVISFERLRYCLSIIRPKHNRINTHWTKYSREWKESNLWDSWFRMLTLARIDKEINQSSYQWGFINYPGIGYNYILKNKKKVY